MFVARFAGGLHSPLERHHTGLALDKLHDDGRDRPFAVLALTGFGEASCKASTLPASTIRCSVPAARISHGWRASVADSAPMVRPVETVGHGDDAFAADLRRRARQGAP